MALPKMPKPEITIISKIDAHLKKIANPYYGPDYKPNPRVKPSDLGSPCMRKILYSYLRVNPDQKIKPEQKRIFDTGTIIHELIGDWVKGAGLLIEYKDPKTGLVPIGKYTKKPDPEFPIVVPELDITIGKIDALIMLDGKLWIGEWKSSKGEKFDDMTDAQEEHKMQANTYVHLFEYCWARGDYDHIEELKEFKEVSGVRFLYLNKNNSELKEFVVPKEDSSLDAVVEKICTLKKYVEDKALPPKTEHYCFFCNWNLSCKKDMNPMVEQSSS